MKNKTCACIAQVPARDPISPHTLRGLIVERINQHSGEAKESFALLKSNCDADHLIHLLANIKVTFRATPKSNFQRRFGFSRKTLRSLRGRMLACARDIEKIPIQRLRYLPKVSSCSATDVPQLLVVMADRLGKAADAMRQRGNSAYDRRLAALANYVYQCFGQPYHARIAAVVAAMRGDKYTEAAHKDWVRKHPRLLVFTIDGKPTDKILPLS